MKIYSLKTLLASVLLEGFFIHILLHFDGLHALLLLILWGYLIIEELFVCFSEEAYQKDIRRSERGKRVYRKLFGKLAPFAP